MSDNTGGFSAPPPPPPPPSAGGGGALPSRSIGEILSTAFDVYKANWQQLIVIVAIVVVPLTLISTLFTEVVFAPNETTVEILGEPVTTIESQSLWLVLIGSFLGAVIGFIISFLLQAAVARAAATATLGDPVDVEGSYRWGFRNLGSVILISILAGLIILGGLILFIIPGIIFMVMLAVVIPALVVENKKGTAAIGRSWELVKGHFWHVLGTVIVVAILTGIVVSIFQAIGSSNWVLYWIFSAIGTIITAPFSALATVVLYLDLRARAETLTGDQLRAEIAANA
jgi:hypothetical protein